MTPFHETRFPFAPSRGAEGGPQWRTEIVELASGAEARNALWAGSRRRWEAGPGVKTRQDLARLIDFFEARKGRLHGFRFRDPADHVSGVPGEAPGPFDQPLGVGDGETTQFQLAKRYEEAGEGWSRPIAKPVEGSVRIGVDAVEALSGWTADDTTGLVTFDAPPGPGAALTAGFEFDTPVRFDADHLPVALNGARSGRALSIPLIEIRI